jgi:hypothetical protein
VKVPRTGVTRGSVAPKIVVVAPSTLTFTRAAGAGNSPRPLYAPRWGASRAGPSWAGFFAENRGNPGDFRPFGVFRAWSSRLFFIKCGPCRLSRSPAIIQEGVCCL